MADDRRSSKLAGDLRSPQAQRRVDAMGALAAQDAPLRDEERDALVDCLRDERKLVQRRAAEAVAARMGRDASLGEVVRRLLASAAWRDRWGAVYALSLADQLGPEGIEILAESLDSPDRDLRWAGLDLLKRVAGRHRAAVVDRAVALARNGAPVQRRLAFYLLRDLGGGGGEGLAAAGAALAGEDAHLRLAALAAFAAAGFDSAEAARRIAALVSDADPRIGRAAAAALGTMENRPPEVLEALRRARESADSSLRRAAQSTLRRLRWDV